MMRPRSAKSPIRGVDGGPAGGTVGRWTRPEPLLGAVGGIRRGRKRCHVRFRVVWWKTAVFCRLFIVFKIFQAGKWNVKFMKPHFLIVGCYLQWVRWLTEVYGTSGGSSSSAVCVEIYCLFLVLKHSDTLAGLISCGTSYGWKKYCLFLNCRILVPRIGWRRNLEIVFGKCHVWW